MAQKILNQTRSIPDNPSPPNEDEEEEEQQLDTLLKKMVQKLNKNELDLQLLSEDFAVKNEALQIAFDYVD